jgi:hypothetical protein
MAPAPQAAQQLRSVIQMAPGICGANNPANDTSLRRLSSGLRNTGTVTVSVVCTLWGDDSSPEAAVAANVYVRNDRASGANFTCTLTHGIPVYGQTTSTKTVYVAANSGGVLSWTPTDYGTGTNQQWVMVQCSLPQAMTIQEITSAYYEDVGN